jgi:hypothetical protein
MRLSMTRLLPLVLLAAGLIIGPSGVAALNRSVALGQEAEGDVRAFATIPIVLTAATAPEPSPSADDGHGAADDGHGAGHSRADQPSTGIPLVLLVVLLAYSAAALTVGLFRRRQA